MRRFLSVLAALALTLAACGEGAEPAAPSGGSTPTPSTTSASLDVDAPLVGGGTFEAASTAGKDLALWFWSPW